MSFESLWSHKSRTVWVKITLFIPLTLKAETNVEQKNGIQRYSEVLNTYFYTNLTSYKEIFNIIFK